LADRTEITATTTAATTTTAAAAATSSNDTPNEAPTPKPPSKKKPPPGKPSYLIPKKDNAETNETDEDEQQLEETVEEEAPTPPNPKPKKRPPAGIPSYLIKKVEPEEEATEEETPAEKEHQESLAISTNEPDLVEEEAIAELVTPSLKPKTRPPAGIPSYLIKKEEEPEPLVEAEAEAIAVEEDEVSETEVSESEVSETEVDETEVDETPPKPEPEKRPPAGIPSYLIKKEEPEETKEEERARKKAELQAGIREEEAEIARLEQKARERAEARAKLEAELNEDNNDDDDDENKKYALKKGAAIAAGLAATAAVAGTAAVVVSERKKKKKVKAELVQNHDLAQELSQMPPEDQPSPSAPPEGHDDNVKKKEQFYTVAVPVGVRGGQAFKVNVGGTVFEVTCPPNVGPGESIRVSLPKPGSRGRFKSPKSSPTATSPGALHYVVVPAGVSAGMPFRVRVGTSEFTVKCPPTAMAGQRIGVRVPTRSPIPSPLQSPVNIPPKKRYVIVPPNIYPGMHFVVDVNGQRFKVTCPPNTQPGERIAVTVPGAGGHSTTPPAPTGGGGSHVQYFDVIVPQGVLPGSRFKVRANGKEFVVTCPANVGPGQKIRVPVSTSSANRNRPSSQTTYDTTSRPNNISPVRTYNTANFQPYV